MAEKLCQLKKKGGGELKETSFWTNSSPTSSFTAGSITVPDITPYKLIKVTFRVSTSNASEYYELYTPDQLLNARYADSTSGQLAILGFFVGSSYRCIRYFRAKSATSISFSNCILMGGSDNNNYIIPTKITGLK